MSSHIKRKHQFSRTQLSATPQALPTRAHRYRSLTSPRRCFSPVRKIGWNLGPLTARLDLERDLQACRRSLHEWHSGQAQGWAVGSIPPFCLIRCVVESICRTWFFSVMGKTRAYNSFTKSFRTSPRKESRKKGRIWRGRKREGAEKQNKSRRGKGRK